MNLMIVITIMVVVVVVTAVATATASVCWVLCLPDAVMSSFPHLLLTVILWGG